MRWHVANHKNDVHKEDKLMPIGYYIPFICYIIVLHECMIDANLSENLTFSQFKIVLNDVLMNK